MLFSDPSVSTFVRNQFVAAWEAVRPVPIVEIDFGNGRKIKRTVNGNIATYICAPDGQVVGRIPGPNRPTGFQQGPKAPPNLYRASLAAFDKTVIDYHAANLSVPSVYVPVARTDVGKALVESRLRFALISREAAEQNGGGRPADPVKRRPDMAKRAVEAQVRSISAEEAAILAADTEINRKERKPIIHRILSEKISTPSELTKRLYKEALHCDLDDPYLGLISDAFNGGAYENR